MEDAHSAESNQTGELGSTARRLTGVRPRTIVVVGNGKSVLGSGLGSVIDTYDEVARFNFFKTEGYEQDVGTRTSIWIVAQIKDPKDSPEDGRKESVSKIIVPFSYRGGCKRVDKPCKVGKDKEKLLKTKMTQVYALYKAEHIEHKTIVSTLDEVDILYTKYHLYEKFPSSGLQMLTFFTRYFDRVAYIGFDFDSNDHDHYFEVKVKNETCHNMKDEARIIAALEAEGRLVPLLPAQQNRPPPVAKSALYKSIKTGYDPDCKIMCDAAKTYCKKVSAKPLKPGQKAPKFLPPRKQVHAPGSIYG